MALFGRLAPLFYVFAISLQNLELAVSAMECNEEADKHKVDIARNMIKAYVEGSKTSGRDMSELSQDVEHLFQGQFSSQVIKDLLGELVEFSNSEDEPQNPYADRFVRGMLDVISDPDCMTREFDANDEDFDLEDATQVFQKCKLLVIRNAFDLEFLDDFRSDFTDYVHGIHDGHISSTGKTSNGEGYFLQSLDHKRWEVILMKEFAHPDLITNEYVTSVLGDPSILGSQFVLHSFGSALSEPGANGQRWHIDDAYLFGTDSFSNKGVGGHDLPSYAATMMVPMLNMTNDHGPTEFCMGSSFMNGFDYDEVEIKDRMLREAYNDYLELEALDGCPMKYWRSPKLRFGDVVIFDYQLKHRGGPNQSPDMRAMIYMTYSRHWFKDINFVLNNEDEDEDEDEDEEEGYYDKEHMKTMLRSTRFAMPDNVSEDYYTATSGSLESINALFHDQQSDDNSEDTSTETVTFVLSNKDVDMVDLIVVVDEVSLVGPSPGNYITVEANAGSTVLVKSSSSSELKSWIVGDNQGQVVLSR